MSNDQELPLSQHDVLDPDDCALICDRVIALRNRWTERSSAAFTRSAPRLISTPPTSTTLTSRQRT